jgi:hypothetical protein
MKNARLTFQTESHDFYVGETDKVWENGRWVSGRNILIYNILPRGTSPSNVGGYFDATTILGAKGYGGRLTAKVFEL